MPSYPSDRIHRRALRLPVRLVLLALCVALGLELAVRFLVLSDVASGWSLPRPLRDPSLYGSSIADDLYWEMQFRGLPPSRRVDIPNFHPELGWTGRRIRPGDLAHIREDEIGERRLILLFGDSFADGVLEPSERADFGALLEDSTLSRDWILLNYGTGGYGLDQILLLMRRAIRRHRSRSPVVVVSLLVDDDIDRCVLSFRSWPKPRLDLVDGALVEPLQPVPRVAEYLAEHSTLPFSLVWHLIVQQVRLGSWDVESFEQMRMKQELGEAILRAMVAELRAEGLPHLFLLFFAWPGLERPESLGWRETLVTRTLDELDSPWVSVRPAFLASLRLSGRRMSDYFLPPDVPAAGHYGVLGNRITFEAILEGLHEHLGIGAGGDLGRAIPTQLVPGRTAAGSTPASLVRCYPALAERGLPGPYVILQPREGSPGEGFWTLSLTTGSLHATAALLAEPPDAEVNARVAVEVDGVVRESHDLRAGEAPVELQVDLRGARTLRLRADLVRSSTRICRVVLGRFEFAPDPEWAPIVPPLR